MTIEHATVVVWHNITTDMVGRSEGLEGFRSGHAVSPVLVLENMSGVTGTDICEEVFRLLNVGDDPTFNESGPDPRAVQYRMRGNRSLSVGDVIQIGVRWFACASSGWVPLVLGAPTLCVGASRYGTHGLPTLVR